jgi:hypothetical protein
MTPKQALEVLITAADLAPLPGPQRREWEAAARVLVPLVEPPTPKEKPDGIAPAPDPVSGRPGPPG